MPKKEFFECIWCGENKELNEKNFGKNKWQETGFNNICMVCRKNIRTDWECLLFIKENRPFNENAWISIIEQTIIRFDKMKKDYKEKDYWQYVLGQFIVKTNLDAYLDTQVLDDKVINRLTNNRYDLNKRQMRHREKKKLENPTESKANNFKIEYWDQDEVKTEVPPRPNKAKEAILNKTQGIRQENKKPNKEEENNQNKFQANISQEELEILIEKYGYGYPDEEYVLFEKKYNLLKNNYPEKTAMHTEALLNYIRYRVKEELSTAKGDVKDAKEWGQLAQKAAQDAKINPSQLTKADLSDGLSTFSELAQAVEREVDVIPILPRFKYRPNDAIDFNIWCYINYMRDLSGLPPCKYEDVYAFYDRRKQEYIEQYGDPYGIFEGDTTEKNRENIIKFIKEDDIQ